MSVQFDDVIFRGDKGKLTLTETKISFQPHNAPSFKSLHWKWSAIKSHQEGTPTLMPSSKHNWSMQVNARGTITENLVFELPNQAEVKQLQQVARQRSGVGGSNIESLSHTSAVLVDHSQPKVYKPLPKKTNVPAFAQQQLDSTKGGNTRTFKGSTTVVTSSKGPIIREGSSTTSGKADNSNTITSATGVNAPRRIQQAAPAVAGAPVAYVPSQSLYKKKLDDKAYLGSQQETPEPSHKPTSSSRVAELKKQMAALNASSSAAETETAAASSSGNSNSRQPPRRTRSKIDELKEQMRNNSEQVGRSALKRTKSNDMAGLENIAVGDLRKKLGGQLPGKLRVPQEPGETQLGASAGPAKKIDAQKKNFLESKLNLGRGPPPGVRPGGSTNESQSLAKGPAGPATKKLDKGKKNALESKLALQLKPPPPRGPPPQDGNAAPSAFQKYKATSGENNEPIPIANATDTSKVIRPKPMFLQELQTAVPEDVDRDVGAIEPSKDASSTPQSNPLMGELQSKLLKRPEHKEDLKVGNAYSRSNSKVEGNESNSEIAEIPGLETLAKAERRKSQDPKDVPPLASLSTSLSELQASLSKLQTSQSSNNDVATHAAGAAAAAAAAAVLYKDKPDEAMTADDGQDSLTSYNQEAVEDDQFEDEPIESQPSNTSEQELPHGSSLKIVGLVPNAKRDNEEPSMMTPRNLEELNKMSRPPSNRPLPVPPVPVQQRPPNDTGSESSLASSDEDGEENDFAPSKLNAAGVEKFENEDHVSLPPPPERNSGSLRPIYLACVLVVVIIVLVIVYFVMSDSGEDNGTSVATLRPSALPTTVPVPAPTGMVAESPTIPTSAMPVPSGTSPDTVPTINPANESDTSSSLLPLVPGTGTATPTFEGETGSPMPIISDNSTIEPIGGGSVSLSPAQAPAVNRPSALSPTIYDNTTAIGPSTLSPTFADELTLSPITPTPTFMDDTPAPSFVDEGSTQSPTIRTLPPSVQIGTSAPQFVPTSSPTITSTSPGLIVDFPDFTEVAFDNPLSPQSQARNWLLADPSLNSYEEWKQAQRFALATFFYAFNGDAWPPFLRESWMQYDNGAECLWLSDMVINVGFEDLGSIDPCNDQGRYISLGVYEIDAVNSNVHQNFVDSFLGTIPPEVSYLTSLERLIVQTDVEVIGITMADLLPIQLIELTNLTKVDLSHSYFREWDFSVLSQISSLEQLKLAFSDLEDVMPTELGLLISLVELDVSNSYRPASPSALTDRSGSSIIPSEIGLLTGLSRLFLSGNRISGPFPSELGPMTSLEWLEIKQAQIQSFPPPSLTNLLRLDMADNPIESEIPTEIGLFTSLQYLDLSSNLLVGRIPPELELLTNLKTFRAVSNALVHSIPNEIGLATSLRSLDLGHNMLTGQVPPSIGLLSDLQVFNIDSNMFTGQLPSILGSLKNLTHLLLQYNDFDGSLPSEIAGMGSLEYLDLTQNRIRGRIPTEFASASSLVRLILDWNLLSGKIPTEVGLMTMLETFSVRGYTLAGQIPTEMGSMTALEEIWLSGNPLTGFIPTTFGLLTDLFWLNLELTTVGGTIPSELGLASSLFFMYLNETDLSGSVPAEVCDLQLEVLAVDCATVTCDCASCGCDLGTDNVTPPVF